MAVVPSWLVHQSEIDSALERAQSHLPADVQQIRYSFSEDWTGEPSIYFRVLLSDNVGLDKKLFELAQRVRNHVIGEVKPDEWGLQPYFNFRTVSEQRLLRDKAWE